MTKKLTTETQRFLATVIEATEFHVSLDIVIENDNRKIIPIASVDSTTRIAVIYDPIGTNLEPDGEYTEIYRCRTEEDLRNAVFYLISNQEQFDISDTDPYDVNPDGVERYSDDAEYTTAENFDDEEGYAE